MNKIILEDFNEGDGYYKVNLAYLNKKQVEEIEALVSKWKPTDEDIINCIGMCLTDANEQRFKDYGTNLKECLAWLEKQGLSTFDKCHQEGDRIVENSDGTHFNISQLERVAKVEPKFHEGDWIVNNNSEGVCQVTEIRDDEYCLWPLDAEIMGYLRIIDVDNDYHLWTIQDAKSGDILSSKDKSNILIFRNLDTSTSFSSYYNIAGKGELGWSNNCFIPATKEQRGLLFEKMNEAGYEWDAENKKLIQFKKQGEQKPIIDGILTATNFDKIFQNCNVHKFNVGDWIISKYMHLVMQILNNDNGSYKTVEIDGTERNDSYDYIERNFKLWTIQDAKDGDVLFVNLGKQLIIFGGINSGNRIKYYCCFLNNKFSYDGLMEYDYKYFLPATKEQRNLLFQKMKEAGYEWNAEKKELRKMEQKSKWSENDEDNLNMAIYFMRSENTPYSPTDVEPVVEWLCGLKQRMEK